MPRVKWVIASLLYGTFVVFLCGCGTTTPGRANPDAKESLFKLYQRQEYEACLAQIEKMRNPGLPREDQAELLLMEALCREEMNQRAQADEDYRTVIQKFRNSTAAHRAAQRLARQESDQTEHFTIEFAPGSWQRLDKQWNSLNLRERYVSKADSRQAIIILAKNLGPERGSVSSAIDQVKAALRADAEQVDLKAVEEPDGAYFEFTARNRDFHRRESINGEVQLGTKMRHTNGLGRLLLTEKRMHVLIYSSAEELEPAEKEKWFEALRKARLVRGSAQSIGTSD